MKKVLFYLLNLGAFFTLGYFSFSTIYFGTLLKSSRFFDEYSAQEKLDNGILFWVPIIVMIVLEVVCLLLGKKISEKWGWKDRILSVVLSMVGVVSSGVVIVFLHP